MSVLLMMGANNDTLSRNVVAVVSLRNADVLIFIMLLVKIAALTL